MILAERLSKKNVQETVGKFKDFVFFIIMLLVNNWNCEKYLKHLVLEMCLCAYH